MRTIITCAITGAQTTKDQTPYLPITPEQIADSALEAAEAGAAVVHLHVRDPETGAASMEFDLYRDTVNRIRKNNSHVLLNLTTGPGGAYRPLDANSMLMSAQKRVVHVQVLKPELCSIDFNTMSTAGDSVRINHKSIISRMLELVQRAGTKPELEIFDSGDLRIAKELIDQGIIKGKPFWQFAMGIKYGWDASQNTLTYAHNQLPPGSNWSAFGISRQEMPIVAQTMLMGGHVRVGLEDNIYTSKGVLAKSNAELVKMAADIIKLLGGTIADTNTAREILLQT